MGLRRGTILKTAFETYTVEEQLAIGLVILTVAVKLHSPSVLTEILSFLIDHLAAGIVVFLLYLTWIIVDC